MPSLKSTWISVPAGLEGWVVANAVAALAAGLMSFATSRLVPSIGVAGIAMGWCWLAYGPESGWRVGLANLVTAVRLFAVLLVLAIAPDNGIAVAIVAGLVYVFDGVDGWLARQRGESSAFGAQFDMETDSHIVLLTCVYLVVRLGYAPWTLAIGAMRYLYVVARWLSGVREVRERRSSWTRIVYSFVVVSLAFACAGAFRTLAEPLVAAGFLALVWSFTPDFMELVRARSRELDGGESGREDEGIVN